MKKKKYQKAVGLRYDACDDSAPAVSVKGEAFEADEITKIANRFGVPVVGRPELAASLSQVQEGESIPEELYEAVAIILSGIENAKKSV